MTKGKEWKLLHLSSSQPVALPTYQPFMPSGFSTAWQRAIVPEHMPYLLWHSGSSEAPRI